MAIDLQIRLSKWLHWPHSITSDLFKRLKQRTFTLRATRPSIPSRYKPCEFLMRRGISSVVWFEDALFLYGSDTAVFDLYILVSDFDEAVNVLQRKGYHHHSLPALFNNDERTCRGGRRFRLAEDTNGDSAVVIIDASEWRYDFSHQEHCETAPTPSLSSLIQSLMWRWLTLSEAEYSDKFIWALSLVNLINYAYNLDGDNYARIRSSDFAAQLPPEYRELHYDLISQSPQKCGISAFGKHSYHAMRYLQIQQGKFVPEPYPDDGVPPSLAEYPGLTGLNTTNNSPKPGKIVPTALNSIDEGGNNVN